MLTKFRSVVSKSRSVNEHWTAAAAQRRTLRAEPLEGRLLLTGDSWVVPVDVPTYNQREAATDNDGNVYVAVVLDDVSDTNMHIWLGKFGPAGQTLWTKDLRQQANFQGVHDLGVGQDGVYIVGGFNGSVDFDLDDPTHGELYSEGGSDGYVAKFSTVDGGFMWARQCGDALSGRVAVSNGNLFVTGETNVAVKSKIRHDLVVASLSSEGLVRWEKTVPNGDGIGIAVDASTSAPANVFICGGGSQSPTLGPVVFPPAFVAKFTEAADGQDASLDWALDLGANRSPDRIAVGTAENDGIYAVSDYGAGGELVRISDTGNVLWSTSMTSTGALVIFGWATLLWMGKQHM